MITRKTRRGIAALLVLTSVSYWVGHRQDKDVTEPVTDLDPKLNYVLRDFELQFYDADGQPSLNMQAPVLRNDPELLQGTIEQPALRLNQNNAIWDLNADTAIVTADKEHVKLSGKVRVQRFDLGSGNQVELHTSEVRIEVTPQTASTDEMVDLFDTQSHVSAIGLDLDMKANTFKLKQEVKGTYAVN